LKHPSSIEFPVEDIKQREEAALKVKKKRKNSNFKQLIDLYIINEQARQRNKFRG